MLPSLSKVFPAPSMPWQAAHEVRKALAHQIRVRCAGGGIRILNVFNETVYLRPGEERPARHHRVELTAPCILTFGDRQCHLFRYAAPAGIYFKQIYSDYPRRDLGF